MPTAHPQRTARTRRLNIRATERQEKLIRTGAQRSGISVTDFILESACQQAEHLLAEQKDFVVSAKQYAAFLEALDRPARVKPELLELFSEKSSRTHGSGK